MTGTSVPMIANIGAPEILLILLVLVLLFGASKLPELARGSGRALRIFKAETKGLMEDDDKHKTEEQKQIDAQRHEQPTQSTDTTVQPRPDAER
jgi:sec-independent protein translocase protein TatA